MSANEKKETCYFSHDANAKDDFKVMLLIEELGLEGYGIFWVLIETLREQQNYKYPLRLLSVLARKYNTTLAKLEVVVRNYHLFVIEDDCFFYSSSLNRRMQKMEEVREQRVLSAKIGAQKRKQKQLEQLKQLQINLSNNDSSEQTLGECPTNAKQIKEKKNKEKEIKSYEDEAEKFEQLNEHLLSKQLSKDLSIEKLENLVQANTHTQVEI
ncbi:DUF4373 domain-containing protein [Aliarcobacter butzleri]|uniref:DUF4373 domain-containing protein n=1 Tax=Aliarcobacter butzleri TaxID=28197 RepID=A0AAW7PTK9_9BACT|nr:DUF4373 domain-containing protein [Aliarcobacter butzleri]MDN5064537.1 DUF4373 domain-containing protein [Aliarcobacter butzleri]MDN5065987.1 DUF4373 domain-containing protein [Aliarcobacter butzleri]